MENQKVVQTTTQTQAHTEPAHQGGFFDLDPGLMIWSWISFFIMLAILTKTTWRPVLKLLKDRENMIAKSLEDSKVATEALDHAEGESKKIVRNAQEEANQIIKEAKFHAKKMVDELKEQTAIDVSHMKEQAKKNIENEKIKAMIDLKSEIALIVSNSVETILNEKIDNKKANDFIDKSIKNFNKK